MQSSSEVDEESMKRAFADPEIQTIMKDPQMMTILSNLQANPQALGEYIKDPKVAAAIQKLTAAGILRCA